MTGGAAAAADEEGESRKQRNPKASRAARKTVMGLVRRIERATAIVAVC